MEIVEVIMRILINIIFFVIFDKENFVFIIDLKLYYLKLYLIKLMYPVEPIKKIISN